MDTKAKAQVICIENCSGFIGRFVLRELLTRSDISAKIFCNDAEFEKVKGSSLFLGTDLSRVETKLQDKKPSHIILCEPTTKILEPYATLYQKHYIDTERVLKAAASNDVPPKIILISSCYVHPQGSVGKPVLIPDGLTKGIFSNDYSYVKYLTECLAKSYSEKLNITILRLSSLSPPCGWLDAHPCPEAMGHLAIVSLILRNKLKHIYLPRDTYLNCIPVDIAARSIVDEVAADGSNQLKQICTPDTSIDWTFSVSRLYDTLQRVAPNIDFKIFNTSEDVLDTHLQSQWGYKAFLPHRISSLKFHQAVNRFISKFYNQRFESSVPATYFPEVQGDYIYEQVCMYAGRGHHQYALEKGIPKSPLDQFWGSLPNMKIFSQIMLREPVKFKSKAEAEQRFIDIMSTYRLYFTDPDQKSFHYALDKGPIYGWTAEDSRKDERAVQVEVIGDYTEVKGFKMISHHAVADGISYMTSIVPRINTIKDSQPQQTIDLKTTVKQRSLSYLEELFCFVYYILLTIKILFSPVNSHSRSDNSNTNNHAMVNEHIEKRPGKSFTVSLIEQSFPVFSSVLKKDQIVYSIQAATEGLQQRGLNVPHNSFTTILIPWKANGGRIQEMLLHSKSVKALSMITCSLCAMTGATFFRDELLKRCDVIFSSLMASDRPYKNVKSLHFLPPQQKDIPFTFSALTIGNDTSLTLASSLKGYEADEVLKQIIASK
jgi:nucleoside-diphosphate-sugar epimerase